MHWDEVFAELQAEFEAAEQAEAHIRVLELAEAEVASTRLADRLRARRGQRLRLRLTDASDRDGEVADAGDGWVVLAQGERRSLIPQHAIVTARSLAGSAPGAGAVERALTLGHVLRALGQDGVVVLVHTAAGSHRGRIVRVGADHLDLADDAAVLSVPWHALVSVDST